MQRSRIGFAARSILGEDADGKGGGKLKFVELAADAFTGAAGDDAEVEAREQKLDDLSDTGKKGGALGVVGLVPEAIRFVPFVAWKIRSLVDAEPIRGIVKLEIVKRPGNTESAKHGEVRASVGRVGIEESAVPIEKDSPGMKNGPIHKKRIVSENAESVAVITRRKLVVALESDIVEAGGVASPTGNFDVFGADDVSGSEQLNAAHAERTVHKSDLKLDGGAGLNVARGQEIDAAGADIASDEGDRIWLDSVTDPDEAHRQS